MNLLDSPEGFFALFVGLFLLSEIVKGSLKQGTSTMSGKARTKGGIIVILIFVGILWIIFASEISALFELVNSNGVVVAGLGLVIIGLFVWKSRGVKE